MPQAVLSSFLSQISSFDASNPQFATLLVDALLAAGQGANCSDIHLQPTAEGLEIRFRLDGVLRRIACLPPSVTPNVVARLKVVANLLTYQMDYPQEGRIRSSQDTLEMRVSTFPTLHGERAVVRLFSLDTPFRHVDDLGLPAAIRDRLVGLMSETSGAILVSGPAGSGKTTTVYACLREVAANGAMRSMVSIEDPIEVAVGGVAQSQVNLPAGLDLATGLRFLMRQDPEVIMVGEIRDRTTAEAALGASLTGHLLLSTFHAGSAAETVGRLLDMGIEPYVLRSGLLAIVSQRLVRKLCHCTQESGDPNDRLGLPVERCCVPVGCTDCGGTGYRSRFVLAEMLIPEEAALRKAVLARCEAARLEQLAIEAGMVSQWQRAIEAVIDGQTSPAEVRRVLGFVGSPSMS